MGTGAVENEAAGAKPPASPGPRWLGVLCWSAAALVLLVSAAGWVRLVAMGPKLTQPRAVAWRAPDGSAIAAPPARFRSCHIDGVPYATDGTHVWFACDGPSDPSSQSGAAIVRVDASRAEAKLWFPPQGLIVLSTVAMLPGQERTLAIVFHTSSPARSGLGLLGGVVGEQGWLHSPSELGSGRGTAWILGAAWEGRGVEIAVTRPTEDAPAGQHGFRASPAIVRLDLDGTRSERIVDAAVLRASLDPSAAIEGAYRSDGTWHFLVRDPGGNEEGEVWDVREDGSRKSTGARVRYHVRKGIGLATTGQSERGRDVSAQLLPDGRLSAAPEGPVLSEGQWKVYRAPSAIEAVGEGLRPRPRWRIHGMDHGRRHPEHGTIELVDGQLISSYCPWQDLYLWPGPPDEMAESAAHMGWCPHFEEPAWVVRPGGGTWLVTGSGAYVTAGADMKRTDPLDLVEHLRAEAVYIAKGPTYLEPLLVALLVVLLSSGPVAALIVLVPWLRMRARRFAAKARRRRWLCAGLLLYALAELYVLAVLWTFVA